MLPIDKVAKTTVKKITSIVSQIRKYLTPTDVILCENQGKERAESDFSALSEDEKTIYNNSVWLRSEKWTLLWCIQYANKKHQNQRHISKEWQALFKHHCPMKKDIARTILTTQKYNILHWKVFTQDQLETMEKTIEDMLQNNKCPILNPIPEPSIEESNITVENQQEEQQNDTNNTNPNDTTTVPHNDITPETNGEDPNRTNSFEEEEQSEGDERTVKIEEDILNVIEEVKRMSLDQRPELIKITENKTFKNLKAEVNQVMSRMNLSDLNLEQINNYHFGTALYIQRKIAPWYDETKKSSKRNNKPKTPPWKVKITKRMNLLRAEISQMTSTEPLTKNLINRLGRLKRKYNISQDHFNTKIAEHSVKLKALASELKNRTKKYENKRINKQFRENPRNVYRDMTEEKIDVENPPEKDKLDSFWRPLFEEPKDHKEGEWIEEIIQQNSDKPEMDMFEIDQDDITFKLKTFANFKKPGVDKIPNFWLKQLSCFHSYYVTIFNQILNENTETPIWFTTGKTSLLPKTTETTNPRKYRPICCLPTSYKLLTGIISDKIYEHLDNNQMLEEEQKGCRRRRQGTKHQLLINNCVLEDCKRRARNLSMAWIDYQKAYDSVPHSWISRCLDLYKINPKVTEFLKNVMQRWTMDMTLRHSKGEINLPNVKVRRGIFQGDSLSPLIFCIAVDPLSKLIKKEKIGYSLSKSRKKEDKTQDQLSHLLYMDDLKLYAEDEKGLDILLGIVHTFSTDIGMDFGLDKCAICVIKKGKNIKSPDKEISEGKFIHDLEDDSTYKYLGIEENSKIEHKTLRIKAKKEYIKRLKKICRSQLSPKNKITAINQMATPVLAYGFGIIDWPQNEIDSLDVKTRKILTMHKIIYRNQCMDRLYIPRREGGMGLFEINDIYRKSITNLDYYIQNTHEKHIQLVKRQHQEDLSENKSITKLAEIFRKKHLQQEQHTFGEHILGPDYVLQPSQEQPNQTQETAQNREETTHTKHPYMFYEKANKKKRWKTSKRAGYFFEESQKSYIDKKGSFQWLQNGELTYDEERLILAAQDQGLMTNGFKKMCGISQSDKCRFCHTATETSSHLLSGCQTLLADGHYTKRHNKVCSYIHWTICQANNIQTKKVWEHQPEMITTNEDITIFYDKPIPTGRYIENSAIKPDIVIKDDKNRSALIIDVSVPNDFGINRAEREKVTKYQDLKNALREEWELDNIQIIPIIIGATGLIKDNLQQYLDAIPGKPSKYQCQVAAIRGTVSLLKRCLGSTFL